MGLTIFIVHCQTLNLPQSTEVPTSTSSTSIPEKTHPDPPPIILPSIAPNLQVFYDFEHPSSEGPHIEQDLGHSGTPLELVNGGEEMRVQDGAHAGSQHSLLVTQIGPNELGNNDWKAGVWQEAGVQTLSAFASSKGATIMTWVKRIGEGPALNTQTPDDPSDIYNAMGLAGILSGDSDGHSVRFLLELISIDGTLRLVALGRRVDGDRSQIYIADEDYRSLLPQNEWIHLAGVFNFEDGTIDLYRNGQALSGFYRHDDNPWNVGLEGSSSSATNPRGIKIGGSYPQNTREKNPGQSRLDEIMFIDRTVTAEEVQHQFLRFVRPTD